MKRQLDRISGFLRMDWGRRDKCGGGDFEQSLPFKSTKFNISILFMLLLVDNEIRF